MKRQTYIFALFLLISPLLALAAGPVEGIRVTDAWVRATHPGQLTGVAYMTITSDKAAKLVKVETSAAKRAEIHNMEMKESVMVMREVETLDLPEFHIVNLAPGGYHIMLMDLKQPLKPGEKVPLKLSIKRGAETLELDVQANVLRK
ncbi:MAG: copper chaperone PCu(A)C [Burkholderiales bacterium]